MKKKKPLINIYQNCFCQPSLSVMSCGETVEYQHIFTWRNQKRGSRALAPPGAKSKELREAHVNNCKPIKITLHLNCDLYWFAFQFSSVRLSDCLEGVEVKPVSSTQFLLPPSLPLPLCPPAAFFLPWTQGSRWHQLICRLNKTLNPSRARMPVEERWPTRELESEPKRSPKAQLSLEILALFTFKTLISGLSVILIISMSFKIKDDSNLWASILWYGSSEPMNKICLGLGNRGLATLIKILIKFV